MKLDNYARDFELWRDWAAINYRAAITLFETNDPFLFFPAATLGHHALEMYLKSAMIANGMTVFKREDVTSLDPGISLAEADCVWGHSLVKLAEALAKRNAIFDPLRQMDVLGYLTLNEPMTIREGLGIFDPFFSELRYPQEMKQCGGLGEHHKYLLDSLVTEMRHARFHWNRASVNAAHP